MQEETEPKTDPQNDRPSELELAIEQRHQAEGFAVAHGGTRHEDCDVDAHCERGNPDDWFEVHYAASGQVVHFCARHALAAEALVSLAGWRAVDVAAGLRILERGHGSSLPAPTGRKPVTVTCPKCKQRREAFIEGPRHPAAGKAWLACDCGLLGHVDVEPPEPVGVLVRCGQATCPSLAVYRYEWLGEEKFACQPCGAKAKAIARAMGFNVTLVPLPGAAASIVENGS
ncbi:MAG TPA: hypothetical protein VL131_05900 [Gammaproteobacteria bacterium]|nr:hypothetical protein [Gammaproteobacteria bacterium]